MRFGAKPRVACRRHNVEACVQLHAFSEMAAELDDKSMIGPSLDCRDVPSRDKLSSKALAERQGVNLSPRRTIGCKQSTMRGKD